MYLLFCLLKNVEIAMFLVYFLYVGILPGLHGIHEDYQSKIIVFMFFSFYRKKKHFFECHVLRFS